jgi:hypothetical protein
MNRKLPLILLLVCVVGFVFGIAELFKLRFETGDVYPAYSSLRNDPLGASALYESLGRMPGITVSRDFRMTDQLPVGEKVAYLHLAGTPSEWRELPEESFKAIEYFLGRGGRLVIALEPQTTRYFDPTTNYISTTPGGKSKDNKSKSAKPFKKKKMIINEDEFYKTVSLDERWGINFGFKPMQQDGDIYEPIKVVNRNEASLPDSVMWHGGGILTNLDESWRVIYARGKDAVLAERRFGPGSVVFSTDSYFLSNEAMQKDRHAELLSWIIGPSREIVFDEAHLGIVNESGVATLMRNYHLHGLIAGLLLLAGLFIWKNSARFVPPHEEERVEDAVAGKDSATGFVNLLRRHVKSADLLELCVTEWKKSAVPGQFASARTERVETLMRAQKALSPNERTPIATYRAICQALKENSATKNISEPATRNPASQSHEQRPS